MSTAAILKMFGFVPQIPDTIRKPKPAVVLDKIAEAEADLTRNLFANAMACAAVNNEARKVCAQTAEVKRVTQCYTDQRKTEPIALPNIQSKSGTCRTCEYYDEAETKTALCLNPEVLAMRTPDQTCERWEGV